MLTILLILLTIWLLAGFITATLIWIEDYKEAKGKQIPLEVSLRTILITLVIILLGFISFIAGIEDGLFKDTVLFKIPINHEESE